MIRGESIDVNLTPQWLSEAHPVEMLLPAHLSLTNGSLTAAGHWRKRPGFAPKWETGANVPILALIPDRDGYAVGADGTVWRLRNESVVEGSVSTTRPPQLGTIGLVGDVYERATWVNFNDTIIIGRGTAAPWQLNTSDQAVPLSNAPRGGLITTLDDYLLLADAGDTKFRWTFTPTSWNAADFNSIRKGGGEKIRMLTSLGRRLYIFTDASVEIWRNVGGAVVFAREAVIPKGTRAGHSVVHANNTLYFYGNDGDFYVLDGDVPKVISAPIRASVKALQSDTQIYGFDFRDEHLIRWYAPASGRSIVYDYLTQALGEDFSWAESQIPLRITAHMERNGRTYLGEATPNGIIHEWSRDYFTDDGTPIRVQRQFIVPLTTDGTTARVNRLRLRLVRGENEQLPQQLVPQGLRLALVAARMAERAQKLAVKRAQFNMTTVRAIETIVLRRLFSADIDITQYVRAVSLLVNATFGDSDRFTLTLLLNRALGNLIRANQLTQVEGVRSRAATALADAETSLTTKQARVTEARDAIDRAKTPAAPLALIRWRFDRGSWTPYVNLDLGQKGDLPPYTADIFALGIGREIEVELVETDAVQWLVTHAHLVIERLGR